MEQGIILNFPPGTDGEIKSQVIQAVNKKLDPIKKEVNSWNGFIDMIRTENEKFQFVAICDNEDTRQKMQEMLTD